MIYRVIELDKILGDLDNNDQPVSIKFLSLLLHLLCWPNNELRVYVQFNTHQSSSYPHKPYNQGCSNWQQGHKSNHR
jgi:hypothetical protein